MVAVSYEDAVRIRAAERDRALGLDDRRWPAAAPPGWEWTGCGLRRMICETRAEAAALNAEECDAGSSARAPETPLAEQTTGNNPVEATGRNLPARLEELILRFPSAPIHGLQRLHLHHFENKPVERFHSLRVLRSAEPTKASRRISRVFLMHTGLNERDRMDLYYRLASQLIHQDPATVCIVRPFPGHLTRFPFQAFAETPMDHYLWDGSHLFRQFMRFMVETQWFLSAIVRRSSYRCASGAKLLREGDDIDASRINPERLADDMRTAWVELRRASRTTARREGHPSARGRRDPGHQEFVDAITALRSVLDLEQFSPQNGNLVDGGRGAEPHLHVLGYSLGGFTAQSVFMSWPFLISSCSSVLAGGTLKELAPTGFTDPEEWQTVLHSLRYELDDRMMSPTLGVSEDEVAGINRELFTYLKRTFYEVFQQDYRGSIQTRLEAFRERMVFIVGGDDPVVRPETVLQSGPKGGLNLLEVGGLGHFFGERPGRASKEQHDTFWLPQIAALVHHFANNAADRQDALRPFVWFNKEMSQPQLRPEEWNAAFGTQRKKLRKERDRGNGPAATSDATQALEPDDLVGPLSATELIEIEKDGSLPGELFERCLDDLLYRTMPRPDGPPEGVLFVLRNEVPTALLHPTAVRETAAALYHDDFNIVRYCHGVAARQKVVERSIPRMCLVLPWNAATIMRSMDLRRGFPSQAESAGGGMNRRPPSEIWEHSLKRCEALARRKKGAESIRRFDGRIPFDESDKRLKPLLAAAREFAREEFDLVPSLPDCWVWLSRKRITTADYDDVDVEQAIDALIRLAPRMCKSSERVLDEIKDDHVRIVSVSRARFNPRFRGRLIVDGATARKRLLHVALCLARSQSINDIAEKPAFL